MTIAATLRRLFLLTLVTLGFSLPANSHAATLAYTDGDIFLSFRATGGVGSSKAVLVNLGPVTQFINASGAIDVNLGGLGGGGNILPELEASFGADWKTRADVLWSVSGVQFSSANGIPQRTLFASRAETTAGTQSTPWDRPTINAALNPANKMRNMASPGYSTGDIDQKQSVSTNSPKALLQFNDASNSYTSFMPGGSNTTGSTAFSFFVGGTFENHFGTGTTTSVLDLYTVSPDPTNGPAVLIGGFRMNDSGTLRFEKDVSNFGSSGPTTALVKFDAASYSVAENVGTGKVTLTLQRTGNTTSAVTVNFSTTNDEAIAGTDFTSQTNTPITFAGGVTTQTVDVTILDRDGHQGDRDFIASITVASGDVQTTSPSSVPVTITETDPMDSVISFSAATYTVAENGGTATITLNRTGGTTPVSVNFSTTDDEAIAGTDYVNQTGTVVNFNTGENTATVNVAVIDVNGFQGSRALNLVLSTPSSGATIGTLGTAKLTITENDPNPAGRIAFSSANYSFASKNSAGLANTVTVTLERTAGTTGAVSVDLSVATGGTLDGADFTLASPTTVQFADGDAVQTVDIPLAAVVAPLPGTINLQLSNATGGAAIGTQGTATVTISAPDKVIPLVKVTTPKAGKGLASFDVTGGVTESDDVNRVEVTLNGGAPQLATLGTKANGITPFNLNGLSSENGPNVLLIQAFDSKGTASKVVKVSFTYVNSTLALEGSYNGLITPTLITPPNGNLHNASGLLTVTVTKTGTFTGKVFIGGSTLPVSGVLTNSGVARFKPTLSTTLTLVSKGKAPVTFGNLSLSVALDATLGAKATGVIGGTATVTAPRAFFDGKLNLPDADYLTANKGKFTAVLPSKAQAVLQPAQFPQGDGIGGLTLVKTGKITYVGTLADGTAVTASGPLSKNYRAALYAPLYAKKGSLAGVIALDKTQTDSDLKGLDFLWLRPEQLKAKNYVAGWPGGVKVDFLGARYVLPPKGTVVSVFPGLGADDLTNGNASLQFLDGKLTNTQTKSVNISAKNKVTNAPATDKTFKLALVTAKGTIAGSFNHTDLTKPAFKGIIYQKGPDAGGYGFFLSIQPKNGAPGESGAVTLSAK